MELGWGARGRRYRWKGRISINGGTIQSVEPRFRGAEVVSPLEGKDYEQPLPSLRVEGDDILFEYNAEANPNNQTSATQGFMFRVSHDTGAILRADLSGQKLTIPFERLYEGSKSGNLGAIDTPAWRFHALPKPYQWQWKGHVPLGTLIEGETTYVRLRQAGGQMAWTSPFFVR